MPTKPSYEELEQRIRGLENPDQKKYSCAFINLMENATDFLYFKDKEHRFTAASQVFAKLTGHKHWQDIIGKHDRDIFPEKNAKIYYEAEIAIMKEGKPLLNWREPYLTLEGTQGWVNTNKWPIKDEHGNVIGLFGISRDITELVKAQEDRERLISKLKKALAEVKTLGGLIPICSSCKKIRDDKGYWNQIESYIQEHSEVEFSHGVCPECSDKLYGDQDWYIEMKKNGGIE